MIIPKEVIKDHKFYGYDWHKNKVYRCEKCGILLLEITNRKFLLEYWENTSTQLIIEKIVEIGCYYVDSGFIDMTWEDVWELQNLSCDELIIKNIIE
jgi:hypothetical protein